MDVVAAVQPVSPATGVAPVASPAQDQTVITDRSQLNLIDMAGNPLPPEKIGVPGRNPLAKGTGANPDYQNNLDRLHSLSDVILDTTGAHTKDEQLAAWNSWFSMSVTGQLMGFGPDESKLSNDIASSPISQDIANARRSLMFAQMDAIKQADAAGGDRQQYWAQATLKHLDGLSGFDKKLTFAAVNAPDMSGKSPFANYDAWTQQLQVWAGLFAPLDRGDRLDLSDEAKASLAPLKADQPSETAKAYSAGTIADLKT